MRPPAARRAAPRPLGRDTQLYSLGTMPKKFKSKLYERNNAGKSPRLGAVAPRVLGGWRMPNPRPPVSTKSINRMETKALTGSSATLAMTESGQCFHLDQITQGPGVTQRLGQKTQITAVHIRGHINQKAGVPFDNVGYYLVWDRQPNEALATPGDILALTGVNAIEAFPNLDTQERFIILGKKMHKMANEDTAGSHFNDSMTWTVDDYFQFSRKLVTTTVLAGSGLISDRVSGALLIVGVGRNPVASASNFAFNYRCYFNDV